MNAKLATVVVLAAAAFIAAIAWFGSLLDHRGLQPREYLTCSDLRTGDKIASDDQTAIVVDLNAETVALEYRPSHYTYRYACDEFELDGWSKTVQP